MKTILDKIDPKYIECSVGTCEHINHNSGIILLISVALILTIYKYKHAIITGRS